MSAALSAQQKQSHKPIPIKDLRKKPTPSLIGVRPPYPLPGERDALLLGLGIVENVTLQRPVAIESLDTPCSPSLPNTGTAHCKLAWLVIRGLAFLERQPQSRRQSSDRKTSA